MTRCRPTCGTNVYEQDGMGSLVRVPVFREFICRDSWSNTDVCDKRNWNIEVAVPLNDELSVRDVVL